MKKLLLNFTFAFAMILGVLGGAIALAPSFYVEKTVVAQEDEKGISDESVIPNSNNENYWQGDESLPNFAGASGDVININTPAQLAGFARAVNNNEKFNNISVSNNSSVVVKLTADIVLSGKIWTPIGISSTTNYFFIGTFDGNGYSINGLTIDNTVKYDYNGLFGYTKGSIKNLTMGNINISATSNYVGGLTGYQIGGNKIINCGINGGTINNTGTNTGGLVGYSSGSTIEGCYSNIMVSASSNNGILLGNNYSSTLSRNFAVSTSGNFVGTGSKGTDYFYNLGTASSQKVEQKDNDEYWYNYSGSDIEKSKNNRILKGVGNIYFEFHTYKSSEDMNNPSIVPTIVSYVKPIGVVISDSSLISSLATSKTISEIKVIAENLGLAVSSNDPPINGISMKLQMTQRNIVARSTTSIVPSLTNATESEQNGPFIYNFINRVSDRIYIKFVESDFTILFNANKVFSVRNSSKNISTFNLKYNVQITSSNLTSGYTLPNGTALQNSSTVLEGISQDGYIRYNTRTKITFNGINGDYVDRIKTAADNGTLITGVKMYDLNGVDITAAGLGISEKGTRNVSFYLEFDKNYQGSVLYFYVNNKYTLEVKNKDVLKNDLTILAGENFKDYLGLSSSSYLDTNYEYHGFAYGAASNDMKNNNLNTFILQGKSGGVSNAKENEFNYLKLPSSFSSTSDFYFNYNGIDGKAIGNEVEFMPKEFGTTFAMLWTAKNKVLDIFIKTTDVDKLDASIVDGVITTKTFIMFTYSISGNFIDKTANNSVNFTKESNGTYYKASISVPYGVSFNSIVNTKEGYIYDGYAFASYITEGGIKIPYKVMANGPLYVLIQPIRYEFKLTTTVDYLFDNINNFDRSRIVRPSNVTFDSVSKVLTVTFPSVTCLVKVKTGKAFEYIDFKCYYFYGSTIEIECISNQGYKLGDKSVILDGKLGDGGVNYIDKSRPNVIIVSNILGTDNGITYNVDMRSSEGYIYLNFIDNNNNSLNIAFYVNSLYNSKSVINPSSGITITVGSNDFTNLKTSVFKTGANITIKIVLSQYFTFAGTIGDNIIVGDSSYTIGTLNTTFNSSTKELILNFYDLKFIDGYFANGTQTGTGVAFDVKLREVPITVNLKAENGTIATGKIYLYLGEYIRLEKSSITSITLTIYNAVGNVIGNAYQFTGLNGYFAPDNILKKQSGGSSYERFRLPFESINIMSGNVGAERLNHNDEIKVVFEVWRSDVYFANLKSTDNRSYKIDKNSSGEIISAINNVSIGNNISKLLGTKLNGYNGLRYIVVKSDDANLSNVKNNYITGSRVEYSISQDIVIDLNFFNLYGNSFYVFLLNDAQTAKISYYDYNNAFIGEGTVVYSTSNYLNVPSDSRTRTGYTFKGWMCTDNNKTYIEIKNGSQVKSVFDILDGANVKNVRFNEIWEANSYTVTFNVNGGNYVGPYTNQRVVKYDDSKLYRLISGAFTELKLNINEFTNLGFNLVGFTETQNGSNYLFHVDKTSGNITLGSAWSKTKNVEVFAKWESKEYEFVFDANGATDVTGDLNNGRVNFNTNDYRNVPNVSKTDYDFDYWYFKVDTTGYMIYTDGRTSSLFDSKIASWLEANQNKGITFKAVWKYKTPTPIITIDQNIKNWVYDAKDHIMTASQDMPYTTTYQWYKLNGDVPVLLSGKTQQTLNVRYVGDSGTYRCVYTAKPQSGRNNEETITYNKEITINITPKDIIITNKDSDTTQSQLVKVFDNTNIANFAIKVLENGNLVAMDASDFSRLKFTINYKDVLAKNYSFADFSASIAGVSTTGSDDVVKNSYRFANFTGVITPFIVDLDITGKTYFDGETNNKLELPFTSNNLTSAFKGLFSVDTQTKVLTTSSGIGIYNKDNGNVTVSGFNVHKNNDTSNTYDTSFIFNIIGDFEIMGLEDALIITIKTVNEEGVTVDAANLSIDARKSDNSQILPQDFTYYKDLGYSIKIIHDFMGKGIKLTINPSITNSNYWFVEWKVSNATFVQNGNALQITVTDLLAQGNTEITIEYVVTNIKDINYDYDLLTDETLSGSNKTTDKFVYNEKIGANVLPEVNRLGFTFVGWFLEDGTTKVTKDTVWLIKGTSATTLTAHYELQTPVINQIGTINKGGVYNGVVTNFEVSFVNKNVFMASTSNGNRYYKKSVWQKKNASGVWEDITAANAYVLGLKNVKDNGTYRYIVIVEVVREGTKPSYSAKIGYSGEFTFNIDKKQILEDNINLSKLYDGTNALVSESDYNGFYINVKYQSILAGASIKELSVTPKDSSYDISNYNFDSTLVSGAINKKDLLIDIGDNSFVFAKDVYPTINLGTNVTFASLENHIFNNISIKTNDFNMGIYSQANRNLKVDDYGEININSLLIPTDPKLNFPDLIPPGLELSISQFFALNFNLTITGKIEITPYLIDRTDISFNNSQVIYDGYNKQLQLTFTDEELNNAEQVWYIDGVISSSKVCVNAGVYTYKVVLGGGGNFSQEEFTATLTINKRDIYFELGVTTKIYDGMKQLVTTSNIYSNAEKTILVSSILKDNYTPVTSFEFASANAGKSNINVKFINEIDFSNFRIANTLTGQINKKDITISINNGISKEYDGKGYSVYANNLTLDGIVNNENITGNITFTEFIDANNIAYVVTGASRYESYLLSNLMNLTNNYNITSIIGSLLVNKARVTVTITSENLQKTYDGLAYDSKYTLKRTDGQSLAVNKSFITPYYEGVNSTSYLETTKSPINAGAYKIWFVSNNNNFIVSVINNNTVDVNEKDSSALFNINKRTITISATDKKSYDGNLFVKTITSLNLFGEIKFAIGDNFINSTLSTTSFDYGKYSIEDNSEVTKNIRIQNSAGDNVTDNYSIVYKSDTFLEIAKASIDLSDFIISHGGVYNSQVKVLNVTFAYAGKNYIIPFDTDIVDLNTIIAGNIKDVSRKIEDSPLLVGISITSKADIKYAGYYYFNVDLFNFDISDNNGIGNLRMPILPKTITQLSGDYTKEYDSTNKAKPIISTDIEQADRGAIEIVGTYRAVNVGSSIIDLTLIGDSEITNSYIFDDSINILGNIIQREFVLVPKAKISSHYTAKDFKIEDIYLYFDVYAKDNGSVNATTGLYGGEMLNGNIVFNIIKCGVYDITAVSDKIKTNFEIVGGNESIDNYKFAGFLNSYNSSLKNKEIEVLKGRLRVDIDNLSLNVIYNGKTQIISFTVTAVDGEINPAIAESAIVFEFRKIVGGVETVSVPKDAGTYKVYLKISDSFNESYELVDYTGNTVLATYFDTAKTLYITAREITYNIAATFTQRYTGKNVVYSAKTDEFTNLSERHTAVATLTTNSPNEGTYILDTLNALNQITFSGFKVKDENGTDVSSNYNLISKYALIEIGAFAGEYDDSAVTNLVYDATDKVVEDKIVIAVSISGVVHNFYYGNTNNETGYKNSMTGLSPNVKDVGSYTFTLEIFDTNDISIFKQTFNFQIFAKKINTINSSLDKIYDGTSSIIVSSIDIEQSDLSGVDILGTYMQDASNPMFDVIENADINFVLNGPRSFNYELNLGSLKGSINQKQIIIKVTNGVSKSFDNTNVFIINSNDLICDDLVSGQILNGFIEVSSFDKGIYDLSISEVDYSNLLVKMSGNDKTHNYSFSFVGEVEITALSLNVIFDSGFNFTFEYDGTIKEISPYVTLGKGGVSSELIALAETFITINYNGETLAPNTYTATVTSGSANFDFSGVKDFIINKRNINLDFGTLSFVYNPTSKYISSLEDRFIDRLIAGQKVSGTVGLNLVGYSVGEYVYGDDKVVISDFDIRLNGLSVLAYYNIVSTSGKINVQNAKIDSSNIGLEVSEFIYNRNNRLSEIVVWFMDSNNIRQTISLSNTTYGSISLKDEITAMNAKSYTIKVVVTNYALDNDELIFTIKPKEISSISFEKDKIFDGNTIVYNKAKTDVLTSVDVISGDSVTLRGNYDGFSAGEHAISFSIFGAGTYPADNYVLKNLMLSGNINLQKLVITANDIVATYFPTDGNINSNYIFTYNNTDFTITEGSLVSGDVISGNITLSASGIGKYNASLSTNNLLIGANTDNYDVELAGNLVINAKDISLNYLNLSNALVYSGKNVVFTPDFGTEATILDKNLIGIIPNYAGREGTLYASQNSPTYVGKYTATYTLDNNNYNLIGTKSFDFEITPFIYAAKESEIPQFSKIYGKSDPEFVVNLNIVLNDEITETVTIELNRITGENVGAYDLLFKACENINFSISLAADAGISKFRILQNLAEPLNVTILNTANNMALLTKFYDKNNISEFDISSLNYAADGQMITGTISITGMQVGSYTIVDKKNNLLNANYALFNVILEEGLKLQIIPRDIEIKADDFDKEYDGNTLFVNNYYIFDKLTGQRLDSKFGLIADLSYKNKNANTGIEIIVTYSGDYIANYNDTGLYAGDIVKRNVTISPVTGQTAVYGATSFVINFDIIDNGVNSYIGNKREELEGGLYIDLLAGNIKYIVGTYTILNNLTSANFNLNIISGITFEITPKELTINSLSDGGKFDKFYDSTSVVKNQMDVIGILEGDVVIVNGDYYLNNVKSAVEGNGKEIRFALSGIDANNYFANYVYGSILAKTVTLNFNYNNKNYFPDSELLQNDVATRTLIYNKTASENGELPSPKHSKFGYNFTGWYLDEDFTIKLDNDTVINESIWDVNIDSKTAYAKWVEGKFIFTLKGATRIDGVYTVSDIGGVVADINGEYSYNSNIALEATANFGYQLIGYANSLTGEIKDISFIIMGNTNTTLYAMFAPIESTISISANGGAFEQMSGWNISGNTASILVEYNGIFPSFPIAKKTGYNIKGYRQGEDVFDYSKVLVDFVTDINLSIEWEENYYNLILDADGGYFDESELAGWEIVTRTDGKVTVIQKAVKFNSKMGEVIASIKNGYDFSRYVSSDNIDYSSEELWNEDDSKTYFARYEEKTFTFGIYSKNGFVNLTVYDSDGNEVKFQSDGNPTTSYNGEWSYAHVRTSGKVSVEVYANTGYTFTNWKADGFAFDGSSNPIIEINGFIADVYIEALFTAKINNINLSINDTKMGSIRANGELMDASGNLSIQCQTESNVEIILIINEGYEIDSWVIEGRNAVLSGTITDLIRTLSGFITDVEIKITLRAKVNEITIVSDEERGTFGIYQNGIIFESGLTNKILNVATGSEIKFVISPNHGYLVNEDVSSWIFNTTSLNNGNFAVSKEGINYIVVFSNFTADGRIDVKYLMDTFDFKVVLIKSNTNLTSDYEAKSIVTVSSSSKNVIADSDTSYGFNYKDELTINPLISIPGYRFTSYSTNEKFLTGVENLQNFISLNDDELKLIMTDDLTIYIVYSIIELNVTFKTNGDARGQISINGNIYSQFTQNVVYGTSSKLVLATAKVGYSFIKWVRAEGDNLIDVTTNAELQLNNVIQNDTYIAIFEGTMFTSTITVKLDEQDSYYNDVTFGDIVISEQDTIKVTNRQVDRANKSIIYTVTGFTGDSISLVYSESEGYKYTDIYSDNIRYKIDGTSIVYLEVGGDFESTIYYKAEQFTVKFKISQLNAMEFNIINSDGLKSVEVSPDKTLVTVTVKYKGSINFKAFIFKGFKLVPNNDFEIFDESSVAMSNLYSKSINAGVKDITENKDITMDFTKIKFKVTFDNNYTNAPIGEVSYINYGDKYFNPLIQNSTTNPTRSEYVFTDYNTSATGIGTAYYFESGQIYYYDYSSGSKVKTYGFIGGLGDKIVSNQPYDYEVTLYAQWKIETFKVTLNFVPSESVDMTLLSFSDLLPYGSGQYVKYRDDGSGNIEYISYKPDSLVWINAPMGIENYTYYGWGYTRGLTRQTINTSIFMNKMPNSELIVYLYYEYNVRLDKVGKGLVSSSVNSVLSGESLTISAAPSKGWQFAYWQVNGVKDPSLSMNATVSPTAFTVYTAVFEGKQVAVTLDGNEKGTLNITATTGTMGTYRAGDIITIVASDILYGYEIQSNLWAGNFTGIVSKVNALTYTYLITDNDGELGSISIKANYTTVKIKVQFTIKSGEGIIVFENGSTAGESVYQYNYDTALKFNLVPEIRYETVSMLFNGKAITDFDYDFIINQQNGYLLNEVNKFEIVFDRIFWIDVYTMFQGSGTEEDPYLITSENELAAMAYLINNNIKASEGKTAYNLGVYKVLTSFSLESRFWQPIGIEENPFDGTFILGNFKVYGLSLDKIYSVTYMNGLFGYVGSHAKFIVGEKDFTIVIIVFAVLGGIGVITLIVIVLYMLNKKRKIVVLNKGTKSNE